MSDDDDDALLEALEKETETDPSIANLREARMQQLSSELNRAKALRQEGCGVYTTVQDEKNLLDISTTQKKCLVHFSKSDFNRCRIMDEHLKDLAERHLEARVCKIDVGNAPFLVTNLGVKVLPCVIGFIDGISVVRIVGFEGLGVGNDNFKTADLEQKLADAGVFDDSFGGLAERRGNMISRDPQQVRQDAGTDEDDDWD